MGGGAVGRGGPGTARHGDDPVDAKVRRQPDGLPEISVVLPFRDAERYLAEAVESILLQQFSDFELLAKQLRVPILLV